MKIQSVTFGLCASVALLLVGCSEKTDPAKELQKAADTFATAVPAPAPPAVPAETPQPVASAPSTPAQPPAQELKQAMVAYKAGQMEDAVTRLQRLRAQTTMSPQQRMALQDAVAAVMSEIYTLAAKGDARAIQAVKQYERMQTQK